MIKTKAVETLMKVGECKGTYRFVLAPQRYSQLDEEKVIEHAHAVSGISAGVLLAAYTVIGKVLTDWVTEGHSVPIPGLGSMRFGLRATSVDSVDQVRANLITSRRIIFIPSVAVKKELAKANINITCYDRNGEVIKHVTSENDKVEDGTEDDNTGSGADNGQQYTITVASSPSNGGTVTGGGQYAAGAQATLKATAGSGFEFSKWSDGNTNAQRAITVNSNQTLTAIFTNTGGGDDGEISGGI